MIKPLLKVIPGLSGNVKLGCELNNIEKIGKNEYKAISRIGHLYPIDSRFHQKNVDVSFLFGNWDFDVAKFYNSSYSDIFYKDTFSYDKSNLLYVQNLYNVIKDRNTDFEFGCKRVSFEKSGCQYAFFAPIYCDNVNDLPDEFVIEMSISNNGMYSVNKTVRIDLSTYKKSNYLAEYLRRYFSKVDDNVIYLIPNSSEALYYGIDVVNGGINSYVDIGVRKNFNEETTINIYDKNIAEGFMRNGLILKQVMPLAFYFNVNDFLTEDELSKYTNAIVKFKGKYIKNGVELKFYMFDDDYEYLSLHTLTLNKNNGAFEYKYLHENVLNNPNNSIYGIKTHNIEEYKFTNKINKEYIRWKLKYSSEDQPYITNTSFNFSSNQNLSNLYYEYPQNYYWTTLFCNIENKKINVLLPIGDNIHKYYEDYKYYTDKYHLILQHYSNNWFDTIDNTDISYIIENTDWQDIHSKDNKILYKGVLYDFTKLYETYKINNKIDKFAVLFYVNHNNVVTADNVDNIVYSKHSMTHNEIDNNIVSTLICDNNGILTNSSIFYDLNTPYLDNNYTFENNQYFSYNSYGIGKYIDIYDIGLDYYDLNKFYDFNDVKTYYNYKFYKEGRINESLNPSTIQTLSSYTISGYELLDISYLSNISVSTSYYSYYLLNFSDNKLYYSYNNTDIKSNCSNLAYIAENPNENRNSYVFYYKKDFISDDILRHFNIITNDVFEQYTYSKEYVINNSKTVKDVFCKVDEHNKFYGNNTSISHINEDNDVLYVDPFNIKEKLAKYNILESYLYIKDINIQDNVIVLSSLNEDANITIYTGPEEFDSVLNFLDYADTYMAQTEFMYSKYNVNKYINSISTMLDTPYTNIYELEYSDSFISNKISFTDNIAENNAYFNTCSYVYNINTLSYIISLTDYDNNFIHIQCADIDDLYMNAYSLHAMSYINEKYVVNQNCVGTYVYKQSYIFTHPSEIVNNISNITYIKSNLYTGDVKYNITSYNTDLNTTYSYNSILNNNETTLTHLDYLSESLQNTTTMYGKFLNVMHIIIFKEYIKQYAQDTDGVVISGKDNINKYIYIKKSQVIKTNNGYDFKDIYISMDNIYGSKQFINKLNCVSDGIFSIKGYTDEFELYFKKDFIKVNDIIYNNIINLDTPNYKDLYIYRLEKSNDRQQNINYINSSSYYLQNSWRIDNHHNFTYYNQSYALYPLFDDVFIQPMGNTVIYKDYLLHKITPVHFDDTTLYRYNAFDKLMLYDTSYIFNNQTETYINTYTESFIYNTLVEIKTPYTYTVVRNGHEYTYIDPLTYTVSQYYKATIPTYDKINDVSTEYSYVSNDIDVPFDETKLNTYTYNGVTYGFYLNSINLSNITNMFSLMLHDFTDIKYFTSINGVDITNNHKYLTDNFKLLVPIIKTNIITQLYDIPTMVRQYKTVFKHRYINKYEISNKNKNFIKQHLGIYNFTNKDSKHYITLYRYYDSIVPRFIQTSNIYTEYALNCKLNERIRLDNTLDNIIYKYNANIYNYDGIRLYYNDKEYDVVKQIEYKYYNDSQFVNLETHFEVNVADNLTYDRLLELQHDESIIESFEKHINALRSLKFSADEILFLFNKYGVQIVSEPVAINNIFTEKVYTLKYIFNLI